MHPFESTVPRTASTNQTQCVQIEPPVPVPVNNKIKRKRMRRRGNKKKEICLKLMGNNVNSLLQKLEALEFVLFEEKPSIIFLQETRLKRAGRIKTPSS